MRFFNLFSKKSISNETKSVVLSDELGSFLKFGTNLSAENPSGALSLYEKCSAVSIPINYISEAFASLSPVLNFKNEIITDHSILDFLQSPSPYFSRNLLLETLAKNYLITGEAEIIASGNINLPPLELRPISPNEISIMPGADGTAKSMVISGQSYPGTYLAVKKANKIRYLNGNLLELKQIRNYSTKNNSLLRGQSPLLSAAEEVRQHIAGNHHNVSLLNNGGRVSLIFHFDEDLTEDDFEITKQRVIEQYGGTSKAGQIGVTAGGKLKIQEISKSNLDMDFINLQKMAQHAVALQYKFPLPLITTDASTFNNYKESKMAMYDDAVLPLADRIFGGLSDFLLLRFNLDPAQFRLTYDIDNITALANRRNEELKLRSELNIETTNEMRSLIGREPVEGGDNILAPASMIPIGTDLFTDDNKNE